MRARSTVRSALFLIIALSLPSTRTRALVIEEKPEKSKREAAAEARGRGRADGAQKAKSERKPPQRPPRQPADAEQKAASSPERWQPEHKGEPQPGRTSSASRYAAWRERLEQRQTNPRVAGDAMDVQNRQRIRSEERLSGLDGARSAAQGRSSQNDETAYLIKDINQSTRRSGSDPSEFISLGSRVVIISNIGTFVTTDGTAGGTIQIGPNGTFFDTKVGTSRMLLRSITFNPATDSYDTTVWGSDGTAAGSKALRTFADADVSVDLTAGSYAYITVNQNDGSGGAIWRTDGTLSGTIRVGDFPGAAVFAERAVGTRALFSVFSNDFSAAELWSANGSSSGTVRLARVENGDGLFVSSTPVMSNGRALFLTGNFGLGGEKIWSTDGTVAGTVALMTTAPGEQLASSLRHADGQTFFTTILETGDRRLWRTDGAPAGTRSLVSGPFTLFESNVTGSRLVFLSDGAETGLEPWGSDGTEAGTALLRDIYPGMDESDPTFPFPNSSNPRDFMAIGAALYFTADDGTTGRQLWSTDGTVAGTLQATTALPPSSYLFDGFTKVVDGELYFGGLEGTELWKFTPPATLTRIADLLEGGSLSYVHASNIMKVNGTLIFTACSEARGYDVWRTDGTQAGTIPLELAPGPAPSCDTGEFDSPSELVLYNDRAYFSFSDGIHGREIWTTDGTTAGTRILKDILPGADHGVGIFPWSLSTVNGKLYFSGRDLAAGPEPWVSDGTTAGTHLIKDLLKGNDDSLDLPDVATIGNKIVFASNDGFRWSEPWVSDGTTNGTKILRDIVPQGPPLRYGVDDSNDSGSQPLNFFQFKDVVLFGARLGSYNLCGDPSLFKTDGTPAGTTVVATPGEHCNVYPNQYPNRFVRFGDDVYFSASDGDAGNAGEVHGQELWKSDLTEAGTFMVADLNPDFFDYGGYGYAIGSNPEFSVRWNGDVLGAATTGDAGREPWRVNGTTDSANMIEDLVMGPASSGAGNFTTFRGSAYFFAVLDTPDQEWALWKMEPNQPPRAIVPFYFQCQVSTPLVELQNKLYFMGCDEEHGYELWVTDGTAAGTKMVVDIYPGSTEEYPGYPVPNFGAPLELTVVDGQLLFSARTAATGRELWKSNGLASGTKLVKDILPGPDDSQLGELTRVDDRIYFGACDLSHGCELWKSNGKASGTEMVQDVNAGPVSSFPERLVVAGKRLFFYATDAIPGDNRHGMELWGLRLKDGHQDLASVSAK